MKNNFSNFIKIILIIISIVLVIWLVFFLITRNDYSQNHQTPSQTTPDNNISIIEEELTTIFSYINNTKDSNTLACTTLGTYLGYDITASDNFFDYYAPVIMDCLYEKNYPTIIYDANLSYKIISEDEWNTYDNYFISLKNLISIKDVYTIDILNSYSASEISNVEYYINNNYKIAYAIADNQSNNITYKINRIFKEDDHYVAKLTATLNNREYSGDLIINIVDGHCQYEPLFFY